MTCFRNTFLGDVLRWKMHNNAWQERSRARPEQGRSTEVATIDLESIPAGITEAEFQVQKITSSQDFQQAGLQAELEGHVALPISSVRSDSGFGASGLGPGFRFALATNRSERRAEATSFGALWMAAILNDERGAWKPELCKIGIVDREIALKKVDVQQKFLHLACGKAEGKRRLIWPR